MVNIYLLTVNIYIYIILIFNISYSVRIICIKYFLVRKYYLYFLKVNGVFYKIVHIL